MTELPSGVKTTYEGEYVTYYTITDGAGDVLSVMTSPQMPGMIGIASAGGPGTRIGDYVLVDYQQLCWLGGLAFEQADPDMEQEHVGDQILLTRLEEATAYVQGCLHPPGTSCE